MRTKVVQLKTRAIGARITGKRLMRMLRHGDRYCSDQVSIPHTCPYLEDVHNDKRTKCLFSFGRLKERSISLIA